MLPQKRGQMRKAVQRELTRHGAEAVGGVDEGDPGGVGGVAVPLGIPQVNGGEAVAPGKQGDIFPFAEFRVAEAFTVVKIVPQAVGR